MSKLKLGSCGIDCNKCPIYIGTATGDQEVLDEYAAKSVEAFGVDFETYRNSRCLGCHQEETNVYLPHCGVCNIRKCAVGNGYETCAECDEYTSCEMLQGVFDNALQPAKENLDLLRKK